MTSRSNMESNAVLSLTKEGGKSLTVGNAGNDITLIFWRKNNGVLLPIVITQAEAMQLVKMLNRSLAA